MHRNFLAALVFSAAVLAACSSGGGNAVPPSSTFQAIRAAQGNHTYRGPHVSGPRTFGAVAFFSPSPMPSTTIDEPTYYGGPVLRYPRIYVTYWNWPSDPSGERPYLEKYLMGIQGSKWLNTVTQYYDTTGYITNSDHQFKGTWSDPFPIPAPGVLQFSDIEAAAVRSASHFGYSSNAAYIIALPSAPNQFECAFHGYTTDSTGRNVVYIGLPYETGYGTACGQNAVNPGAAGLLDGVSTNAGHEVAEAITDPILPLGWDNSDEFEIGDFCQNTFANVKLSTGTFGSQALWSDASTKCVFSY